MLIFQFWQHTISLDKQSSGVRKSCGNREESSLIGLCDRYCSRWMCLLSVIYNLGVRLCRIMLVLYYGGPTRQKLGWRKCNLIFDTEVVHPYWKHTLLTNNDGNNASKNSSNSSSSNDEELHLCSNENSYKARVLLDTLERSVSCCSEAKYPTRRSEGRTAGSMSVSIDDNWGKGTQVQVSKVVESDHDWT